jgi:hypothetical protein
LHSIELSDTITCERLSKIIQTTQTQIKIMKVQTTQELLTSMVERYLNKHGESLYVKTSNPPKQSEHQPEPDEVSTSEQQISDAKN